MALLKAVRALHSPVSKALKNAYPVLLILTLLLITPVSGDEKGRAQTAEKDKCPVCGMFVAKYPDWIAKVVFRDGSYRAFDGAKDMFKYLANLSTFEPSRRREDITSMFVTDYYDVRFIDAQKAFFVIGSDVYGPMGAEFVSFEKETNARTFKKDHAGRRILKYSDVTPSVLKTFE